MGSFSGFFPFEQKEKRRDDKKPNRLGGAGGQEAERSGAGKPPGLPKRGFTTADRVVATL
jgi:hypothetical protein